jgi:Ca2+:H+ antiporter
MARLLNSWTMLAPIAAAAMLALTAALGEQTWLLVGCGAAIIAAVLAAVHHAEVIAHRVGEPFGTLVLPYVTTTTTVGTYSRAQSLFAAFISAALWGIFVFIQTVRHRDYFLPHDDHALADEHAAPPSRRQAMLSFVLLLVSLVAVVGLAKVLSHPLEELVEAFDLPRGVVGIVVALVVLLPETWAAIRAAHANRLQSSMNLAIGSALATIGLTVPIIVIFATAYGLPLVLGLDPKDIVLLVTALLVSAVTLGTGRTSMMQGAVHVVLFATFLFLACVP